jgi:hypothetical protein
MKQRKRESALGRGLDALIRPDANDQSVNSLDANKNKEIKPNKSSVKRSNNGKKGKKFSDSKEAELKTISSTKTNSSTSVEDTLVENVILEVRKNPRISLWSAKSAAVLRLLKKTKPEFSISKEASALIEDAVKDKYPDLWEVFEGREI